MSGDIAELANALGQIASLQEEVERTRNQRDATQVELDGADKVIANLREEVEQLRAALEKIEDCCRRFDVEHHTGNEIKAILRAALKGEPK